MNNIRTNLFEYNDAYRIKHICDKHNVKCAYNGVKCALIGICMNDILLVLDECFDNYTYFINNDILFVNIK